MLPPLLSSYPAATDLTLLEQLAVRVRFEPFNGVATAIFLLAILHTFAAGKFTALAHRLQHDHDEAARRAGGATTPSVVAELSHFLGEVEVVFGLWAVALGIAFLAYDIALDRGAALPGGDLRVLALTLYVGIVLVAGAVVTWLVVPLPGGGAGPRATRTPWSAALGLFAAVPIAYLVLVVLHELVKPLIT